MNSYPKTKPHGCENCKGHSVWMLDDLLDTKESRDVLIHAIDNYLEKDLVK